jgi:uncharacterized protein YdaU (DUF1376 family)
MSFAFLPFFTGDYLRKTRTLSPAGHGIYVLFLAYCWDTKGPVPLDEQDQAGICNARSADEIETMRRILGRFWVRMDDGWYNKRMQREIERAENVSSKRSEAGRAGYEARAKYLRNRSVEATAKHLVSKSSASASNPHPQEDLELSHSVETAPAPAVAGPACPVEKIINLWNSIVGAAGGQKALNLSKARREMIVRRWREVGPDTLEEGVGWFEDVFRNRIASSKFCTGRVPGRDGRPYRIGIDVALRSEQQLDEIAEGKFA